MFGAEGQAGTDDDGLARLHWRRARAAANERDARIDPGASCASAPDRDRGRVDEATLRFALAGIDDLLEEIGAVRFVRAAA